MDQTRKQNQDGGAGSVGEGVRKENEWLNAKGYSSCEELVPSTFPGSASAMENQVEDAF
ncbi:UNVERIFIED_CONTAM: hypothetical protein Sradi_2967800 [Sesamum radiatum]|uniref:Uncharacterized protein n=1 Tax=Sesamum radiatum TaxID=300843 RepID=A0AAW2RZQ6_SESRA